MDRVVIFCLVLAVGVQYVLADAGVSSVNAARIAEYIRKNGGGGDAEDKGPPPVPGSGEDPDASDVGGLGPEDFEAAEQLPELEGDGIVAGADDPMLKSGKFEGDIDLRGLPIEAYVDEYHSANPNLVGDVQRNAVKGEHYRWPNSEVPFIISSSFQAFERAVIASAIDEYNKFTCIRWKPRTTERDYVYIVKKGGCYSSVGKVGGWQELSLGSGCVTKGITIHEMMHALGFYHEQSRTDRDAYVSIYWSNIQPWAFYNFDRYGVNKIDDLGTPYDYGSIMHYAKSSFGKTWNAVTIVPKNGNHEIGQRRGLSQNDIKKINLLYSCPSGSKKGGGGGGGGGGDCVNFNSFCDHWALGGHCNINPTYMGKYCPKACRKCSAGSCSNSREHCNYWRDQGYCSRSYTRYMSTYCKKACNLC